jgi:transcriptional regulator with XRE-family HTH domain
MKLAGELIRERRKRKGWSQTILGDLVGMSAATIHRIEHGEKIPTDQEAAMIAGLLGLEHQELLDACQAARAAHTGHVPRSSFRTQWDTAHPASYAGAVWIQLYPAPETRLQEHQFTLRWGVWERTGSACFAEHQDSLVLRHYKHNDDLGLPLFLTLSHPCYAVFGKGDPPEGVPSVDINAHWRRVEPPEPGQVWRFVRHFAAWYLKRLFKRAH